MERLILLAAFASPLAWAGTLSTPVIGTASHETLQPTAKPAVAPVPAKAAPATVVSAPGAISAATQPPSNPYGAPASLIPQHQIKPPPSAASQPQATSSAAAGMDVYSFDGTPHSNGKTVSAGQAGTPTDIKPVQQKPKLIYRSKVEGRPLYRIQLYQPRTTLTLFNGVCLAENRLELRQQLIDEGIDTRKRTYLHPVVASLPGGRMEGCWYYDRKLKYFRVRLENGQGEDFSREQVEK